MILVVAESRLLHDPMGQDAIHVVAAEGGIASGCQYLEYPSAQSQDRDVEGASAEVVDGVHAVRILVQTVSHGRGGRLAQQPEDLETGKARRVLRSLSLGFVEVGRHRDHDARQVSAQDAFGPCRQHPEDLRRDLDRTQVTAPGTDARHRAFRLHELVGKPRAQGLHVPDAAPDETLDRGDGVQRILGSDRHGGITDFHPVLGEAHHGGEQVPALLVRQGLRPTAAYRRDQRVGRAQVDTRRQPVLVWRR